ncbi:MAG TPA: peptide chain release factor-like protein [Verrucomicrobia bacterium]|jgi:protein subunit release factor B|nr:peptide chain release factor-like protein [Verrucomicrobiales bacterium]HIL55272.1 peptide chain release factor-like protein [Verrucomicrobiota bacterium]|tara:strand:- start:80 stop:490 length:411 start_codon:yes stop_codon:yes gene_type:complete
MGKELPVSEELLLRMRKAKIYERDLIERFIRGSGPGGQKVNKTSSCVQLRHITSGIEVKCQDSRSLMANRIQARNLMCSIIEERERKRKARRRSELEKIRRKNRKPSKRQKKLNVINKRKHGIKKKMRKSPNMENE